MEASDVRDDAIEGANYITNIRKNLINVLTTEGGDTLKGCVSLLCKQKKRSVKPA